METLFTDTTTDDLAPPQRLTRAALDKWRQALHDASAFDRYVLHRELLAVMTPKGEASDNSNKLSTRLRHDLAAELKRFADIRGTTTSALLREAVEFAVTTGLFETLYPLHETADADVP